VIMGRFMQVSRDRAPNQQGSLVSLTLIAFAVVLMTVGVTTTAKYYNSNVGATFLIFTVLCGSVLLAARAPIVAAAAHVGALFALTFLTDGDATLPWPIPVAGVFALGGLLTVLGVWSKWQVALATWWAAVLVLLAGAAVNSTSPGAQGDWGIEVALSAAITGAVAGGSIAVGMRRHIASELRAARRDAKLEQEQRERADERGSIARELHDVVAHSMSLVHMQATSAPYRLQNIDDETRQEFANIARSARSALDEMRQMLGVLRPERAAGPLAPQPSLAELDALIAVSEHAGIRVSCTVAAVASEQMSTVQQLAAYRIVQEALGNVIRHAQGAETHVRIEPLHAAWVIEVLNGPTPAEPHPEFGAVLPDRGGRGLHGMRERVALLGGSLQHGPTAAGGFRVVAQLPRLSPSGPSDTRPEPATEGAQ
jgi:signal transduction histidine kinase